MYEIVGEFLNQILLLFFFIKFFFKYIKMSKGLLAKCYEDNKEKLPKKARER